jgi:hypothetical protein
MKQYSTFEKVYVLCLTNIEEENASEYTLENIIFHS